MTGGNRTNRYIDAGRRYLVVPAIALGVAVSLLPLMETNAWWVRFADYARVQVAGALAILLALYLMLGGWRGRTGWLVMAAGLLALGYHGYRLYPYAGPATEMAKAAEACPAPSRLRVMVANVQKSNREAERLFAMVADAKPDLLLVMETDDWWDRRLKALNGAFSHRVQKVPEDATYFGMHVLSRYPLADPQVQFWFDTDTPTVVSGVELPNGATVDFIGLHPRPPRWAQPTTMRDGHLLRGALAAAQSSRPSVLAGDFNAVPWERTSRRALRIGGLLDPRVGRGLYATYHAESWIVSWPLDQVLHQEAFTLVSFRTLPGFGSDHYPVLAELCHAPQAAGEQEPPAPEPGDLEEARTAIEAARRLK